jgi:hypothetical protein
MMGSPPVCHGHNLVRRGALHHYDGFVELIIVEDISRLY